MYAGRHARERASQPAFIMAGSGEAVTYAEYEARTNRLAHLLRSLGLRRLDHYAVFMENNSRYLECCGAGEREVFSLPGWEFFHQPSLRIPSEHRKGFLCHTLIDNAEAGRAIWGVCPIWVFMMSPGSRWP